MHWQPGWVDLFMSLCRYLLPGWLRRSSLYQATVYRLLRLTIELAGGVKGVLPPDEIGAGELAVRKTLGNVVELAGILSVGWSPLWLLAATSDLTGGTRAFLNAFVAELRKAGILAEDAEIQSVDQLLDTLESSSGMMADMVDMPPLKVQELKDSWQTLQQNARNLPDSESLTRLFMELQQVARQEGRSLGELSGLIATGALRAGVQLGSTHVFDYYSQSLKAIQGEGWGAYALRVLKPYSLAAAGHFNPQRETQTEKILRRVRK